MRREFYRGKSPTEELLHLWSQTNHTVLDLFLLLSRMKHYRAMTIIKPLIDKKYYYLIKDNDQNHLDLLKINNLKMILNAEISQIPLTKDDNNESKINNIFSDISSVAESAAAIPQIPYEDLMKSTNNWDVSSILGIGGFGIVFRGTWKCKQVAIKRIKEKEKGLESYNQQIKQSITELHCLNTYRHDNILPLYG